MANDSSLGSAADSFDFDTQSGVMHLLASVRAGDISASQKNELRDLVFLYSNGGHDQSVRNNLVQKINQYAVQAAPRPSSSAPKIHEFGTSRPAPAFSAAPVTNSEVQPAVENAPTNTGTPKPVPVSTPEPVQKPTPEPVNVPQPAQSERVPKDTSTDIPTNLPRENKSVESVVATEQASPKPKETPAQDTAPDSQAESLQRVKVIKALVNEKVGNPVNLVDINNEVGREYMAALLDAMRKLNSGSSAISAMQRLESAYVSVEEALESHDGSHVAQDIPAESNTTATPDPSSVEPAASDDSMPEHATPIETKKVNRADINQDTPTFTPISMDPAEAQIDHKVEPVESKVPDYEQPMDNRPIVQQTPSEKAVTPVSKLTNEEPAIPQPTSLQEPQTTAPQSESKAGPTWGQTVNTDTQSAKASTQKQVPVPNRYQAAALSQSEAKLRTPDDLPSASDIETSSVAGDALFTQQVDDGLNQLLSDWTLFKKSGLFGTGPKGSEHPLYLKIKDLQIPLLLAGRFDGATREIKQSIADYMNGWRYEQGIIYEQGETFDHYLRRVIRHILDLQKTH
jgi:outer membrane biosynthesis protein TonB